MKIASELELKKRANMRSIEFLGGRYWNLLTTGKTKCADRTPDTEEHMIYHPNSEYRCDQDDGLNEEWLCSDCGTIWLLRIPT